MLENLNEDILHYLFHTLGSKTLLTLMSTCRYLFRAGLPILLARPYGSHFDSRTLQGFHDFLSSYAPTSFLSLQDLEFWYPIDFDSMVDILKRATNLRSLQIGTPEGGLWDSMIDTIIALPELQSLFIRHEDSSVHHVILRQLIAPLRRLHLDANGYSTLPLPNSSNFQDTLEDLCLSGLTPTNASFPFHRLTRLHLDSCPEPVLSVLVNAFPNVEVLILTSVPKSLLPDQFRDYEELRTENITFQSHGKWNSLRSLTVDELGMRTLGLQAEVDSVVLPHMIIFSDQRNFNWFYTSMRSLRPRHLQLTCDDTTSLQQAFSVGMERLDRLDVLVYNPGTLSPEKIMDGIYAACRFLQARMLFCDISVVKTHKHIRLDDFDSERIARRIMLAAPKVSHIKLIFEIEENIIYGLDDPQPSHTSYWAVDGDGDEKQLRELKHSSEMSRVDRMFLPAQIQKDDYTLGCATSRARTGTGHSSSDSHLSSETLLLTVQYTIHRVCDGDCYTMTDPAALRMDSPTLTSLNEDILLHLSHMLTSKTLLALMSTCRYMFRTGLPTLLARPYGSFYDETLSAFYDFLSFFAPTSFSSLRYLRFIGNDTPAEVDIIANILRRATNLRVLDISICDALKGREDIAEAIISLSKLEGLTFTHEAPGVCHTILERLQAPLAYLTLEVEDNGKPQLPLLSNFQDTLEDIYLQYTDLTDVSFSCHKLTQLFLHHCSDPRLSVLMNTFPNLEVLSLNSGYNSTPYGRPEHEELRQNNIAFQAHKQWHSLTSLTVDELGVYMLGLQTEVDSVILPAPLTYWDDEDWGWLNRSLKSLRPRHLRLTCSRKTTGLARALCVGLERLDRLDLDVSVDGDSTWEDAIVSFCDIYGRRTSFNASYSSLKGGIYAALKNMRTRMLSCTLSVNPEVLEDIEDEFDPKKIAGGAMSACTTLGFIILKTSDYHDFQRSYWLIIRNGDERLLQKVEDQSQMSQMEHMFLPTQVQVRVSCLRR
ncbi:hypothetical protein EIP86_001975 [Pleurotus ostreatoroseus]|nr:hypothetical protein EIP86_001975 [Pleurotus ostreatoroseus]